MSKEVIIIGGGAAGMLAAIEAGRNGNRVSLYEKNDKLGKKLYITGKGRCNLTNACEDVTFFQNIVTGKKFMYSAFYEMSNHQTINYFEELGLKTKIERGERVFPVSDHSSDVIRALENELKNNQYNICIHLRKEIVKIEHKNGTVSGVVLKDGSKAEADSVIVATGGRSYPACGSTGDGYRFALECGHTVSEQRPALVPLEIEEAFVKELQGLSLKNVKAMIRMDDKNIYEGFGEMLFTHFGVSGPLILTASSFLKREMYNRRMKLILDLKPALSMQQLNERVLRDFAENQNRQYKNALGKLLPVKLIPIIIQLSGIHEDKKVNEISKEERLKLISLLKNFEMTVVGDRGFTEAVITQGGITLKEINPSTMESKIVKGLYFVGEVLDVDALTGGFNLQIAWSTGYLAGNSIK
jgi:predicted Rossmann fold flavoprotein